MLMGQTLMQWGQGWRQQRGRSALRRQGVVKMLRSTRRHLRRLKQQVGQGVGCIPVIADHVIGVVPCMVA